MLSDCIVSRRKGQTYQETLRPDNVEKLDLSKGYYPATLFSKSALLDPSTIVGFAGDGKKIEYVIDGLKACYADRPDFMRPMEFVGAQIDQANRSPIPGHVDGIGATIHTQVDQFGMNYFCSTNSCKSLKSELFGEMFAVGSGAESVVSMFNGFSSFQDANFVSDSIKILTELNYGLIGALNGDHLFPKYGPNPVQTWGGYFQGWWFDWKTQEWLTTPSWLHCAIVVEAKEPNQIALHPKIVIYQPGSLAHNAGLVCILNYVDEKTHFLEWQIKSWLDLKNNFTSWSHFIPDRVTVTVVYKGLKRDYMSHRTLNSTQMDQFKFGLEGGLNLDIDGGLLRDLTQEAIMSARKLEENSS